MKFMALMKYMDSTHMNTYHMTE